MPCPIARPSSPHKLLAGAQRNLFHLCLLQPHSVVCVGFISCHRTSQLLSHLIQHSFSPSPLGRIVLPFIAPSNFSLRTSNPASADSPPQLAHPISIPAPVHVLPSHHRPVSPIKLSPSSFAALPRPSSPLLGAPAALCHHRLALCCCDSVLPQLRRHRYRLLQYPGPLLRFSCHLRLPCVPQRTLSATCSQHRSSLELRVAAVCLLPTAAPVSVCSIMRRS